MGQGRHVLYFALRPSPPAARQALGVLDAHRTRLGLTGAAARAERLHVSLKGVGRFERLPSQVVDGACRAAARVTARPFRISFNRLGAWGRGDGARPIVLHGDEGVIGVEALHRAIHVALADLGMAPGAPREIWPHMTLLRDSAQAAAVFVAPVSWWVDEFVLIHSPHGAGEHRILARWPLCAVVGSGLPDGRAWAKPRTRPAPSAAASQSTLEDPWPRSSTASATATR